MTQPGSHERIQVGEIEVVALLDSRSALPRTLFPDAEKPGADASFGPGPYATDVNCFAFRSGGRLHLVDAGCGPWRGETNGKLIEAMRTAGLDPADVEAILMTHMHGDHSGGLFTEAGATFPKAELLLAEAEAAFWSDPGLPSRAPERMQATVATANRALATYRDRTTLFQPDREIAPGVTAIALPGHTPGQTGFRIESGGQHLFIWADIIHVQAIQFPHPDWTIAFDTDGAQAARTRQRIFAECAAEGTRVAGMHLAFPTIGQVVKESDGYGWAPAA